MTGRGPLASPSEPPIDPQSPIKSALIIGASRGLGYAMVEEFLKRGWRVTGTVRGERRTQLHELATNSKGRVQIEHIDITVPDHITSLRSRLDGYRFDLLFVNSGITNSNPDDTVAEVPLNDFIDVMVTNALSPMRVLEALQDLVPTTGTLGVMSSGQGSVTNNTQGMREVYRGSKAALNMFMRSFAARYAKSPRAMVLMAPGWIKTDLGGADAPLTIADSVPNFVNVLISIQGKPGLHYLDYLGRTVPW